MISILDNFTADEIAFIIEYKRMHKGRIRWNACLKKVRK
jgi:hypothetical protein